MARAELTKLAKELRRRVELSSESDWAAPGSAVKLAAAAPQAASGTQPRPQQRTQAPQAASGTQPRPQQRAQASQAASGTQSRPQQRAQAPQAATGSACGHQQRPQAAQTARRSQAAQPSATQPSSLIHCPRDRHNGRRGNFPGVRFFWCRATATGWHRVVRLESPAAFCKKV